ncbi:MAG: phytanoyl-CoA dioxygenase family protein [Gammaproteobacteria bacterium]|nr:phytanoyl-CoA dioxygenase family protein [Gammaproteobacteria bacterium]
MSQVAPDLVDSVTLDAFERDGAVLVQSLVDAPVLARLRTATDAALSQSENYFRRQRMWESDPVCRDFCLHSFAPLVAAQLLSTRKINLLYDQVFAKEAGAVATPWHNDQPYWPVRGPAMTLWLALDGVPFAGGSLEFIAGSHKWDRWFQPFVTGNDGGVDAPYEATDGLFEPLPDFDCERDQHTVLCWEMEPGDVIAFHAMVVHGARANSSKQVRRGYAVRYTGEGATYHVGPGVNPRITNDTLRPGQQLDSAQYPVAYRRDV